MRTTLLIDDDILAVAKSIAENRSVSIGRAVSDMARKGLMRINPPKKRRNGLPLFAIPVNAHPITLENVKKMEDDF
ncbi:MAG: CopG family transcriptional regulator [bacterium]